MAFPSKAAPLGVPGSILANLLVLGVIAFAALAHEFEGSLLRPSELQWSATDFYRRTLQEDQALEWATFWGFAFASGIWLLAAVRSWRGSKRLPWYLLGVGCFCALFALEEVSWGQRMFGYRPPVYFLEHNFQQEFNLHNVMEDGLRQLLVRTIILGYGVVLPGLAVIRPVGAAMLRVGVQPPPLELMPSFLAAYWLFEAYPFTFTGELVELMLALSFLFAALGATRRFPDRDPKARNTPAVIVIAVAALAAIVTGVVHAGIVNRQRNADPEVAHQAEQEAEALRDDFVRMSEEHGRTVTDCGLHRRVYEFVAEYRKLAGADPVSRWSYHALVEQGLPKERAEYFLDPWNSPYWIRHECEKTSRGQRVRTFVYSFGPNRRRDSTPFEILGDDVGAYIGGAGR